MITTRPWPGISSPDWFINSDTPHQGTSGPVLQRVTPGPVNSRLILTVVQHDRQTGVKAMLKFNRARDTVHQR
jgi:hypothetical protein